MQSTAKIIIVGMLIISASSFLYLLIRLGAALAGFDTTGMIGMDVGVFMVNMSITGILIIACQNRRCISFQWKGIIDPTPYRMRLARALMLTPLVSIVGLYILLRITNTHPEHKSYFVMLIFLVILLFCSILNVLGCGLGVDKVIPGIVLSFMENPFSAGYQSLSKHGRHSLRQQHRAEKNIAQRNSQKCGNGLDSK